MDYIITFLVGTGIGFAIGWLRFSGKLSVARIEADIAIVKADVAKLEALFGIGKAQATAAKQSTTPPPPTPMKPAA